jgi:hypothetical protein
MNIDNIFTFALAKAESFQRRQLHAFMKEKYPQAIE